MKGRAAVVTVLALLVATFMLPSGVIAQEGQVVAPPGAAAPDNQAAAVSDNQAAAVPDNQAAAAIDNQAAAIPEIRAAVPAPGPAVAQETKYPEGLVHDVSEGDTLWDLAAKHLGSPWLWTELWERNRFVTNPHYIYPGIKIVIFPPSPREIEMPAVPQAVPAETPPEPAPAVAAEPPAETPEAAPPKPVLAITPTEFVRAGEFLRERPGGIGAIKDGRESKVAFSENDRIYLSLDREIPAGQMLGVYRVRGPIPDPAGRPVSGYVKYLAGVVQVTGKENGEVAGVVRKSFEDLSRTDLVSEEIPAYSPVVIDPGTEGVVSTIVASRFENEVLAAGDFVYFDRGADAGIGVGNVFRVYSSPERAIGEMYASDARVSVDVARAVVVRVSPSHSTAYVASSAQSFHLGAPVRRGIGKSP